MATVRPRTRHLSWRTAGLSAAAVIVAVTCFVSPAGAFCNVADPDTSVCHPRITRDALGFLRPWVRDELADHIDDPDNFFILDRRSTDHFDDCTWNGSIGRINSRYVDAGPGFLGVVPALSPLRRVVPAGPSTVVSDYPKIADGMKMWGWLLHAAQDFYSHANWVEMGHTDPERDLIRGGLSQWQKFPANWEIIRDDVMVSTSSQLPGNWRVDLAPDGRIPIITRTDGRRFRFLVSGSTGAPFVSCPKFALLTHDEVLNKDDANRPFHRAAATMATAQTRHEWCRLLHLTWAKNGAAGASVLMGLLVHPERSPHPAGTPCAEGAPGPIEITIRVSRIRVLNDKEDDGPGQINFAFALFTEDFRHSTRTQTREIRLDSNAQVHPVDLPKPLTLCLRPTSRVVATVQAWEDDGTSLRGELSGDDDLLNGVTRRMGTAADLRRVSPSTSFMRRSDNQHKRDLEVTFQVVRSTTAGGCTPPLAPVVQ
jgi:hypothetical protein